MSLPLPMTRKQIEEFIGESLREDKGIKDVINDIADRWVADGAVIGVNANANALQNVTECYCSHAWQGSTHCECPY